jgi:hypothetical protein
VWKPSKDWPRRLGLLLISIACWFLLSSRTGHLGRWLQGQSPPPNFLVGLALIALLTLISAYCVWQAFQADRSGRFIAIRDGMIEMRLDSELQRIDVAEILKADNKWGEARLILRDGRKVSLSAGFDRGEEIRLLKVINECLARHQAKGTPQDSPST